MKKITKAIGLIACIGVFSAFALGSGSTDTSSTGSTKVGEVTTADAAKNETTAATTTAEEKSAYYVGDTFSYDGLNLTFVSSSNFTSDNQFLQPAEGNKYIRLVFHADNQSDSDKSVTTFDFNCYADGYECESTYQDDDLSASLSAGRSGDGAVYFEVPADAAEIEIEYSYNVFSDKKVKFIFEGDKDSGLVFEANTAASADAYHVGDIIENGDLRITYLRAEEYVSDNEFLQPADGNKYIFIELEVENLSSSDQFISYFSFECYADGKHCDGYYGMDDALSATLSSGRKAKGTVAFEVPIDATTIEIEFEENLWAQNKIVFSFQ